MSSFKALHDAPRIAIILPPKEGFTPGAVGAIGLLVERLVRAGAHGTVIGRPNRAPTFPGIPFIPVKPGWGLNSATRYANGIAHILRQYHPALIEVHNWPEIALRLARTGTPTTLILNNDPQSMRGARTPQGRAALLNRLAAVATSSEWLRARFLDGVPNTPRRPTVLPNCIDVPSLPLPSRDPTILFAGRIVSDKGADLFVDACALALPRLPGWSATMIGADRFRADSPDTPFIQSLRPRAAAAAVTLQGHLPNPEVIAAMRRAAIVVVPSRWPEPFGLVALEAMAAGAALICTPNGGLPEVAGGTALYADPTPASLADAILALAQDVPRREALAHAARARAETFDAPAAAQRLIAFRDAALPPPPKPPSPKPPPPRVQASSIPSPRTPPARP